MKIRNGFVSNSSTSSFVIFLKEEDFNEVYNQLSLLEKELVDYLKPTKQKAFGFNIKALSGLCGNYGSFEEFTSNIENLTEDEENALENEGPDFLFDKILDKFEKKEHLKKDVDM